MSSNLTIRRRKKRTNTLGLRSASGLRKAFNSLFTKSNKVIPTKFSSSTPKRSRTSSNENEIRSSTKTKAGGSRKNRRHKRHKK